MNILNFWRSSPTPPQAAVIARTPIRPARSLTPAKPAQSTTHLKPPQPRQRQVESRFKRAKPRPARSLVEIMEREVPAVVTGSRDRRQAAERAAHLYQFVLTDRSEREVRHALRTDFERLEEAVAEQTGFGDDYADVLAPIERGYRVPVVDEWMPDYDRDTWNG